MSKPIKHVPFPSWSKVAVVAAIGVPSVTLLVGVVVKLSDDAHTSMPAAFMAGVILACLFVFSFLTARPLSSQVGRFTATLALSLVWGLVFAFVALFSGTTRVEVSSFAFSGFLLPVVFAMVVLPVLWFSRWAAFLLKRVWLWIKQRSRPSTLYSLLDVVDDATPAQLKQARKRVRHRARTVKDDRLYDQASLAFLWLSDKKFKSTYDQNLSRHRFFKSRALFETLDQLHMDSEGTFDRQRLKRLEKPTFPRKKRKSQSAKPKNTKTKAVLTDESTNLLTPKNPKNTNPTKDEPVAKNKEPQTKDDLSNKVNSKEVSRKKSTSKKVTSKKVAGKKT